MHPDVIRALVRERQAELLRHQQFRNIRAPGARTARKTTRRPVHHLRLSLGSALVVAGTRLLPSSHATADWAVQASRDRTLR
jgi:hypothetical protein